MLQSTFYFGSVRKLTAVFGALFDDISIVRFNENNVAVKTIKVPIAYGPKQKWLQRLTQRDAVTTGPEKKINVGFTLPRISFEIVNIQYDANRQTNPIHKTSRQHISNPDQKYAQRSPVPYDIQYDLHIIVKNAEDGFQIIEQILPFFTPEYSVTVKELPQLEIERDVPIIYTGITKQDSYEGSFLDFRVQTWTLSFVAKTWLYPPVTDGDVIKTVFDNFYTNSEMEGDPVARITVGVNPKKSTEADPYTEYVSYDLIPIYDTNGTLLHYVMLDGTILNIG